MKTYDVKCPICGHMNYSLYLEETDGWMECEQCKHTSRSVPMGNMVKIPVFKMKDLAMAAAAIP